MGFAATIDPDGLAERVRELTRRGRVHAARPLLNALRELSMPRPRLAEMESRLLAAEERPADAERVLDAALAVDSTDIGLRLYRANLRIQRDDATGAAGDAAEAVILDRTDATATATLGLVLIELDRPEEAVTCLALALRARPEDVSTRVGLARALELSGEVESAADVLHEGLAAQSRQALFWQGLVRLRLGARDFAGAAEIAERGIACGVVEPGLFGMLGQALAARGETDKAAAAFGEASKLAPGDATLRELAAAPVRGHVGDA